MTLPPLVLAVELLPRSEDECTTRLPVETITQVMPSASATYVYGVRASTRFSVRTPFRSWLQSSENAVWPADDSVMVYSAARTVRQTAGPSDKAAAIRIKAGRRIVYPHFGQGGLCSHRRFIWPADLVRDCDGQHGAAPTDRRR